MMKSQIEAGGTGELFLRDDDGHLDADWLDHLSELIEANDEHDVRELVAPLHAADLGDVLEAIGSDERLEARHAARRSFRLRIADRGRREHPSRTDGVPAQRRHRARRRRTRQRRCRLHPRGPRRTGPRGNPRAHAGLRAAVAQAHPRFSRRVRRPAHADRIHRHSAVLVGGADDRLHARRGGPARRVLPDLRRRPELQSSGHRSARPDSAGASARPRSKRS